MRGFICRLWKEEDGPAAVEYGLMIALIAAVIVSAVKVIGTSLSEKFDTVANTIDAAGGTT